MKTIKSPPNVIEPVIRKSGIEREIEVIKEENSIKAMLAQIFLNSKIHLVDILAPCHPRLRKRQEVVYISVTLAEKLHDH